jgi:hypothetical protein
MAQCISPSESLRHYNFEKRRKKKGTVGAHRRGHTGSWEIISFRDKVFLLSAVQEEGGFCAGEGNALQFNQE